MNKTKIEWVKNPYWEWTDKTGTIHVSGGEQGYTWNPITGCLNGCEYCYARKLAHGRLRERYLANTNIAPVLIPYSERQYDGWEKQKIIQRTLVDPFYPRFWEDRLDDPFLIDRNICIKRHTSGQRGTPRGIFVCDMGELFGDWIPREWQEEIFLTIQCNPQHRFYLLTKQPQNLIKFSPFPENCWAGVTATSNGALSLALMGLKNIEAKIKYISFEPLLSSVGINDHMPLKRLVDWVIIGAQTKPYKPPLKIWVDEIIEACKKANIPYFLKDNLQPLMGDDLVQDMPRGVGVDH